MVTVCVVLFEMINELQNYVIIHSSIWPEWTNTWMILATEKLSAFIDFSSSFTKSMVKGNASSTQEKPADSQKLV